MTRPPPLPGLGKGPMASPFPGLSLETVLTGAIAAHNAGRRDEAERGYRLAMTLAARDARPPSHLAVLLLEQERDEEALVILDKAVALDPGQAPMLINKGNTLVKLGRYDEALAAYDQAIALQPKTARAEAYNNLGVYLQTLDRHGEAAQAYRKAAKLDPKLPEAWGNLGIALLRLKDHEAALEAFDKAVKLKPGYAEAWTNRGATLQAMDRLEEALESFDRSLALWPDAAGVWSNRALALTGLGRHEEALAASSRAVSMEQGGEAEPWYNHGLTLQGAERNEEALAAYDQALTNDPSGANAWNNRGLVLQAVGRFDDALASYDRAIALKPGYADALWNKALLLIALDRYEEGWALFEWRWLAEGGDTEEVRDLGDIPLWLGREPLDGKTVFVHAEQGFGDTICMLRYLPELAARGAHVVLNAPRPMAELARGVQGVAQVVDADFASLDADFHIPLMSLPHAMGTTLETVPAATPYIAAPQAAREAWAARLGPKTRRRIGLCWSGNAKQKNDRNRSMALETLLPLLGADAEFHSVQKDYRPADLALMTADGRIVDHAEALETFSDTAALIEQMDLVVSVCTSPAHLAGALGKPLLVMLTEYPDYRWGLGRETSPWYPSARLIRQAKTGDWAPVVAKVREALDLPALKQREAR